MQYLLSVGINKYKYPGSDLRGCVNDVLNIRKTLAETCGFSYVAMRTLFDNAATKDNILEGLKNMVRLAVKGDRLVYHHSSHGSQIADTSGDEFDRMDEILCPYDFDWDGTYIVDDELREIFCNVKKGITVDVVLDCCHSGTGLKDLKYQPKFIQPIDKAMNRPVKTKVLLGGGLPSGITLWSGCKDNQTSADAFINGAYNGALTYYFCDALRKSGGNASRHTLYKNLIKAIQEYEQTPQLECSWYRRYRRIFN